MGVRFARVLERRGYSRREERSARAYVEALSHDCARNQKIACEVCVHAKSTPPILCLRKYTRGR